MKRHFKTLDSKTLRDAMSMASLGDSVILNDNIDQDIDFNSEFARNALNNPLQLSKTLLVFLCLEGEIEIDTGSTIHKIGPNSVIVGLGGSIGVVKRFGEGLKFAFVAVDESFYYPILEKIDRAEVLRTLLTNNTGTMFKEEMEEALHCYKQMKIFLQALPNAILQKEIIRGYLQVLFLGAYASILRNNKEEAEHKEASIGRNQEISNRFMEEVQQHYNQERNITFYADKLCITPKYLSQIVHKVTGLYAGEHINRMVIQEAKILLKSKQYTVVQISDMLNFCTPSFFCRYFKRYTGMSPLVFQRKN